MNTVDFRTPTFFIKRKNPSVEGIWGMAIDIGYSGTKAQSPNIVACFPSYAVPLDGKRLDAGDEAPETDILYRKDKHSKQWLVGKSAQDTISRYNSEATSSSIFGRNRYSSEMFKVIAETAMGICMQKNEFGDPSGQVGVVQTGLPVKYMKSDAERLKDVFYGPHTFELKIGSGPWQKFDFNIAMGSDRAYGNVRVMSQPMGTLVSVSTDNDGKIVKDSQDYVRSKTLIIDVGFGTLDTFDVANQQVLDDAETSTNLAMHEVLKKTGDEIYKRYHEEIPVAAFQSALETGTITVQNRKDKTTETKAFDEILLRASDEVARRTIDYIDSVYNDLIEFKYVIITGGTGAAWYHHFEEAYKGRTHLTLIPGNKNDNLPMICSNVRGYYMYLLNQLMKG